MPGMMALVSRGKAAKGVVATEPGVCTSWLLDWKAEPEPDPGPDSFAVLPVMPAMADVSAVWYSSRRNLRTRRTMFLITGSADTVETAQLGL
jgi:hypothetical protein